MGFYGKIFSTLKNYFNKVIIKLDQESIELNSTEADASLEFGVKGNGAISTYKNGNNIIIDGTKLSTLIGEDDNKSTRTIAGEEISKIIDGAPETYNTLKEIAEWIEGDGVNATELSEAISKKLNISDFNNFKSTNNSAISAAKSTAISTARSEITAQIKDLKNNEIKDNTEAIAAIIDGTTPAANATKLGGSAAQDYLKKSDAPGYNDILTTDKAENTYQPKGEYATKNYLNENYATKEYIGEIPEGYKETNIVSYINKIKEEAIAGGSGSGSSESAAGVQANLDTFKTEINPKVKALLEEIWGIETYTGDSRIDSLEELVGKLEQKTIIAYT